MLDGNEKLNSTNIFNKIKKAAKIFAKTFVRVQRDKATEYMEYELKELENLFIILIFGSFIGVPSPPSPILFELLPLLEDEINLMLVRADSSQDALADMVSIFDLH
jgi:hypothetical protein